MMKLLDTLHRWTGGLIGLLLALLGLSGTILLHKDAWIGIPHAGDPLRTDLASVTAATETIMALPGAPQGIIYAHEGFGLHTGRFALGEGAGFYADQPGRVGAGWVSQWEWAELWVVDVQHLLFVGDSGSWETSSAGTAGECDV